MPSWLTHIIAYVMLDAHATRYRSKNLEMTQAKPPTKNTYALPQQSLLLKLLKMPGEIAVMGAKDDSLLWSTMHEYHSHRWKTLHKLSDTATIWSASSGRELLNS